MRELLYEAAKHYRRGRLLAEQGDARGAGEAFEEALRELQAVRPQRNRDVLMAQVYLSRHQLDVRAGNAASDLRLGYAYARTTSEANVRQLAERLWQEAVAESRHLSPARGRKARANAPRPGGEGGQRREAGAKREGDAKREGERGRPGAARGAPGRGGEQQGGGGAGGERARAERGGRSGGSRARRDRAPRPAAGAAASDSGAERANGDERSD